MAISSHDIVPDSPTNTFATWNGLATHSSAVITNGNLKTTGNNTYNPAAFSSIGIREGKYYAEFFIELKTSGRPVEIGIVNTLSNTQNRVGNDSTGWGYQTDQTNNGRYGTNASFTSATAYGTGNIVGVFLNADSNSVTFYLNGATIGSLSNLITDENYYFCATNTDAVIVLNFGQDPSFGVATGLPTAPSGSPFPDSEGYGSFFYDPTQIASDVKALCTANLPDPAIDPAVDDLPEDYFKAVKYTGQTNETGVSTWDSNTSTGTVICGFPVDLAWIKVRNAAGGHRWYDTVRGANKILLSNETNYERTFADELTGFNSNGFDLGNASINGSGGNYIAWCFRAGGEPSATDDGTGVSGSAKLVDTSGTASSTTCKSFKDAAVTAGASNVICPSKMSINQKAGFSIIKYTGTGSAATVPHGLSSAPEFVIIKSINDINNWAVITPLAGSLSSGTYLFLNSANEAKTSTDFNAMAFNASTITLDTSTAINSTFSYIMYCWHSVAGYSKFSSYVGNGELDGPFIYTGFKPAFVIIKCSSSDISGYASWAIYDNARDPYNQMNKVLYANKSVGEGYRGNGTSTYTDMFLDFTSNGFKHRQAAGETNGSSSPTYIYAAFAQTPFKYSATNAR